LSKGEPQESKKEPEQEEEEKALPIRTSSDYSFVDKIINDKVKEICNK
jgi:hypothetical protein